MSKVTRGHPVAADVIALLFSLAVTDSFWWLAHRTHGAEQWAAYGMWGLWGYCAGYFLLRLWRRFRDGVPS